MLSVENDRLVVCWDDKLLTSVRSRTCSLRDGVYQVGRFRPAVRRPPDCMVNGHLGQLLIVWSGLRILFSESANRRGALRLGRWLGVNNVVGWRFSRSLRSGASGLFMLPYRKLIRRGVLAAQRGTPLRERRRGCN